MTFNHTPKTWTDGAVVTMGDLNAELRDFSAGVQAAWTTYTPTWTVSGGGDAPDIGNGNLLGSYLQIGRTTFFRIVASMGTTTTYGVGQWRFTLPMQAVPGRHNFPSIAMNGASEYLGTASTVLGTQVYPAFAGTTAGGPNRSVSATVPFTWGAGDQVYIDGAYENPA